MSRKTDSTRRGFFAKAGAALSAPLALGAAGAAGADVDGAAEARLAELEDRDAIRRLNAALVARVNVGVHASLAALFADASQARRDETIVAVSADDPGGPELIEIAADGATAVSRMRCTVRIEEPIESSCTLVQMARLQGEGCVKRAEQRMLENAYVKRDGVWRIARSAYLPA